MASSHHLPRFNSCVRTMAQKLIVAVVLYAVSPAVASEVSGALMNIDLASARDWTLSIDDGPARGIIVPGGGFNSDRQDPPWIEMCGDGNGRRMVKDHVIYQRSSRFQRALMEMRSCWRLVR